MPEPLSNTTTGLGVAPHLPSPSTEPEPLDTTDPTAPLPHRPVSQPPGDTTDAAPFVSRSSPRHAPTIAFPGVIRFCHPGYPDTFNELFRLPRYDSSPTSGNGVHYGTALVACQIVANNAFNGYLTTDQEGNHRVDLDLNHLLTELVYWFHIPGSDAKYPIVPSFRDWQFPHGQVPNNWQTPKDEHDDGAGISRCVVTCQTGATAECHLVPKAERQWFITNNMVRYGHFDARANLLCLRLDLHFSMDAHACTAVPKGEYYHIHSFRHGLQHEREQAANFHNCIIRQPPDATTEFLFARFARTVIMLVKDFITMGWSKLNVVRIRAVDNGTDEDEKYEWQVETLSPRELSELYSGGGTRSAGPTKRKRNNGTPATEGDDSPYYDGDSPHYDSDTESDNESDRDSDGEGGDRPQKRQCRSVSHKPSKWYEKNVARYMDRGGPERLHSDNPNKAGNEWYEKNVARYMDRGRPERLHSDNPNKEGNEWYKKNVEVQFGSGRGRSRERRGNDPAVQASEPAENADSQPPSLSTSISSMPSHASPNRNAGSSLSLEAQEQGHQKVNEKVEVLNSWNTE
ncbi:hypothetical protein F4803DRAFT_545372 [Xylaria telfairii]|nr:hypothetical protein F4803DRAFT_545372 [Xylaria telfairii]